MKGLLRSLVGAIPVVAVRVGFVWCPIAVVALLLVSGYGGSGRLSANDYRARLATISKESDAAQHAVGKGFQATSVQQLTKVLEGFAADEKRIGDEVAALKPPKDAQAANTELAGGMHETASEIHAVIPKIQQLPTAKAAVAFLNKTPQTKGGREIDDALGALKRLGYIKKVS